MRGIQEQGMDYRPILLAAGMGSVSVREGIAYRDPAFPFAWLWVSNPSTSPCKPETMSLLLA